MSSRTEIEQAAVNRFLEKGFEEDFTPEEVKDAEKAVIEGIIEYVDTRMNLPKALTYVLNLALDFIMVAQKLSEYDTGANDFREDMDEATLFARYPRTTSTADKNVSTLTLTFTVQKKVGNRYQDAIKKVGIRPVEEDVCDLFMAADRTGFTSAYIYNTGMWDHYRDLLVNCFKLSESGRYLVTQRLIDYGLAKFPKNTFFGRETPRLRLFEQIMSDYPRSAADAENAGMIMQGIAYGFIKADRPHLSLIVDKSRTGSAKQRRFGDIDAYYGLDLEVSVEVKDEAIVISRVETELGQFAKDVHRHHTQGLAFVSTVDAESRQWLANYGILAQDIVTTTAIVRSWDWVKQNHAVHGLLHFIAHVEQKPEAVTRLLNFIQARDPSHESLAYLKPERLE